MSDSDFVAGLIAGSVIVGVVFFAGIAIHNSNETDSAKIRESYICLEHAKDASNRCLLAVIKRSDKWEFIETK